MEVDILRSLRHRNIVQYYGASMDNATIYIFMEYVSGGSLQSLLKRSATAQPVGHTVHYTHVHMSLDKVSFVTHQPNMIWR